VRTKKYGFIITEEEIINEPYLGNLLEILKEKGAPILGTFWLEIDPRYKFRMSHDRLKNELYFEFERITE
jgi:hypothetical protein